MSVFLESRYRKLIRGLPQTIFYCPECKGHRRRRVQCKRCEGHGKLTKDSVQELIARHLLPAYKARQGKFHGAGREDVDVRMLGGGRPFVFEVVAPRNLIVDLEAVHDRIRSRDGASIDIDPFVVVNKPRVVFWKESKFDKVYRAEVAVQDDIAPEVVAALVGRAVQITQRTPQRVAHRRADLERERQVTFVAARLEGPRRVIVDVRCSHGTYVKEWISGDDGRTQPSFGAELGSQCRCDVLDVLEIMTEGAD